MNASFKSILHKLYYSISANFLNLFISISVSFIVPKLLEIEQYGYWQLYLLYASYTGFFHMGLSDGIYLRYGGKFYYDLDKSMFHSQFLLLVLMEVIIFLGISCFAFIRIEDYNKMLVIIFASFNCIILVPRIILQYILQSTGRIQEFAKNFILGRILYISFILLFLSLGYRSFEYMLIADISAKLIALLGIGIICKDIILAKKGNWKLGLQEFKINISIGSIVLIANISSMMVVDIVRFGIERNWDVATFGKVSFSLNITRLLLIFMNAISIVIFPIIKRGNDELLPKVYDTIGSLLSGMMLVFLISYYPIQKFLLLWIPHYNEAIKYLALLFPVSIYEARTALLVNTYYKVLREEKSMLLIYGISVLLSLITTCLVTFYIRSLPLAILSITVLQFFKCYISDFYLQSKMKINIKLKMLWDLTGTVVFIIGNWYIEGAFGWLIYTVYVFYMIFIRKNEFLKNLGLIKKFAS